MNELLKEHPTVGRLVIFITVWAMLLVTALVILPFVHPDLGAGAAAVATAIIAIPTAAAGYALKLKGASSEEA